MGSFNFFDKIVLTNLSGETERYENSITELEKVGITGITDVKIVHNYGEIPTSEVIYHIYEEKYNLIKEAKENGYENILILEDDVVFESDASDKLQHIIDNLPSDWELLYLTGSPIQHLYSLSSKGEVVSSNYDINNPPSYANYIKDYDHFTPVSDCLYKLKDSSVQLLQAVAFNYKVYDKIITNFESLGTIEDGLYLKKDFDFDIWLASQQEENKFVTYYACPILATHKPGISIRTGEYTNQDVREYDFYIALLNNLA